jgi:adenine phosphoribosyltransferase
MKEYTLEICGLTRKLPIVPLGPRIKIASFSLLGDRLLVEALARKLAVKLKNTAFDFLIGPEVKVVPLLEEVSRLLKKERYIVCRKKIHGYMVSPLTSRSGPNLVMNGSDAALIKRKKVVILDDVVSSGATMEALERLILAAGGKVVARVAVLRQEGKAETLKGITFLDELPIFRT